MLSGPCAALIQVVHPFPKKSALPVQKKVKGGLLLEYTSTARLPGFETQLDHLPAISPWMLNLTTPQFPDL